jgi:nucleoside-diphosphate-sugar epimerase
MRIGVTGGSGFIGQYLIETLEKNTKTELLRVIDKEKPSFSGKFDFFLGDIREWYT